MLRMIAISLLAAGVMLAGSEHNQLSDEEKLAGWQLLFDGSTSTGWQGFQDTPFPATSWAIEDGTIRTLADNSGGDIVSVSEFENFELVFDWKLVKGGNSGVKYLVQKAWAGPGYRPHLSPEAKRRSMLRATGPEYQLLDDSVLNRRRPGWEYSSSGSLYLLYKAGRRQACSRPGRVEHVTDPRARHARRALAERPEDPRVRVQLPRFLRTGPRGPSSSACRASASRVRGISR